MPAYKYTKYRALRKWIGVDKPSKHLLCPDTPKNTCSDHLSYLFDGLTNPSIASLVLLVFPSSARRQEDLIPYV